MSLKEPPIKFWRGGNLEFRTPIRVGMARIPRGLAVQGLFSAILERLGSYCKLRLNDSECGRNKEV